jgi:hypothetical protein
MLSFNRKSQIRWYAKWSLNQFSRKLEDHWAAVACWFTFYNFCRVHKSLRTTPAMDAGIAGHIWSVRELLEA